jgi:hypothetical protein
VEFHYEPLVFEEFKKITEPRLRSLGSVFMGNSVAIKNKYSD